MDKEFLQLVESHERVWGSRKYKNRPTLVEIMSAPIVAFWLATDSEPQHLIYTITLYDKLDQVRKKIIQMVFFTQDNGPQYRLYRLYQNRLRIRIRDVRITFNNEK